MPKTKRLKGKSSIACVVSVWCQCGVNIVSVWCQHVSVWCQHSAMLIYTTQTLCVLALTMQVQLCSEQCQEAWSVCGCGQWSVSGNSAATGFQLLCWFFLAGSLPGTGGADSGWPVCDSECIHGLSYNYS